MLRTHLIDPVLILPRIIIWRIIKKSLDTKQESMLLQKSCDPFANNFFDIFMFRHIYPDDKGNQECIADIYIPSENIKR